MVDGEPEYEISKILDSKLDNRQRLCKLLYLVKWLAYESTDEETSWLLATKLGNAPELINHFHHQYPVMVRSWSRSFQRTIKGRL